MRLIVSDTGPLLHLHQAGALELLRHFTEAVIAPTVMAELRRHAPEIWAGGVPPWIRLHAPSAAAASRAAKWVDGELLDPGEAEALAMAAELLPDLFLTDDTAARVMAESLGLVARGLLGSFSIARPPGRSAKPKPAPTLPPSLPAALSGCPQR